jgi:peptide methionine sulfoxide reductase MsrB
MFRRRSGSGCSRLRHTCVAVALLSALRGLCGATDGVWFGFLCMKSIMRQSGTERPFSSALNAEKRTGAYVCAACKKAGVSTLLFHSDAKFDSCVATLFLLFLAVQETVLLSLTGDSSFFPFSYASCSGTGWPSFFLASSAVMLIESPSDKLLLKKECRCRTCGSRLGQYVLSLSPRPHSPRRHSSSVTLSSRTH